MTKTHLTEFAVRFNPSALRYSIGNFRFLWLFISLYLCKVNMGNYYAVSGRSQQDNHLILLHNAAGQFTNGFNFRHTWNMLNTVHWHISSLTFTVFLIWYWNHCSNLCIKIYILHV